MNARAWLAKAIDEYLGPNASTYERSRAKIEIVRAARERGVDLLGQVLQEEKWLAPRGVDHVDEDVGLVPDPVEVALVLSEGVNTVGLPKMLEMLRQGLRDLSLTPAQRKGFQAAIAALGEHVAPGDAGPEAKSVRGLVYKAVVDHLGREPISKSEEVRIRKEIYDANPGLAAACRAEEKAAKLAGQRSDDE